MSDPHAAPQAPARAPASHAPASHAEFRGRGYIPELDGLRALSVLLVISVHMYDAGAMWRWLAGWQGVTIFFVLSGYLITSLALREERQRGRVSLAAFYVRRSFRLFPLYYFTLGLYCLLIFGLGMAPGQRPGLTEAMPYFLFYMQEVPFYSVVVLGHHELPFYQSWSLGIEEKFYLVWPVLGFVLWRAEAGLRRNGTFVLTAGFVLLGVFLYRVDQEFVLLARTLFSYHSILVGCLLAVLLDDERWFNRLRVLAMPVVTCIVLAAFLAIHFYTPLVPALYLWNAWGVLYTVATTALLGCVLLGAGPLQKLLSRPALVFVGRLSYGIYLIHLFAIAVAHRLVPSWLPYPWNGLGTYLGACALSIAFAWLLALAFERRFIAWGQRISARILTRQAGSAIPVTVATTVSQARIGVGDLANPIEAQTLRAANSSPISSASPVARE